MLNSIKRPLYLAMGLVVCCAAGAWAQTTNFTLTSVSGGSLGGVYTSPYYATVGTTQNVAVICDDFSRENVLGESWTASVTNLASLTTPSSKVRWNGGYSYDSVKGWQLTLNQAQAYTVAAYLASEIFAESQIPGQAARDLQNDYSYAMWTLFDALDPVNSPVNALNGTGQLTNVENLLAAAESAVAGKSPSDFGNFTIYSYAGGATCSSCGPAQEFIAMPEPSAVGLLGVDLLAVFGLVVFVRRRTSKAM